MKLKKFKTGKDTCKSYMKPVGHGYEVGFTFGPKLIFVGNFVQRKEATEWYSKMNRDIRSFTKSHPVGKTFPATWFKNFLSDFLYKSYYSFTSKLTTRHQTKFASALNRDEKKYKQLKKKWPSSEKKRPFLRAA